MEELKINREESKAVYEDLYLKHTALAGEVKNCIAAQGDVTEQPSALQRRADKMMERLK